MAIIESASTDVLLEREESLAHLRAARAHAAAGHGRLVLVGGEAGVGKTSLVRRFCDELPVGTTVLWGGCDPLATPRPLGPFLEMAERAGTADRGPRRPVERGPRRDGDAPRASRARRCARRCRRGRALGGRGHAGCRTGARPQSCDDGMSRARQLPRRRARRATTHSGSPSETSRPPRPSTGFRSGRSRARASHASPTGPAPMSRPSGASRRAIRSTSGSSSRTGRRRFRQPSAISFSHGSRSSARRRRPWSRRRQ